MATPAKIYRPNFGQQDDGLERMLGGGTAAPAPADDRELTSWVDKQATSGGGDLYPSDPAESIPEVRDAELDDWISKQAASGGGDLYPSDPADSSIIKGQDAGINKAALITSGIGSFLQQKPFNSEFWVGQQHRGDQLRAQQGADQRARDAQAAHLAAMQARAGLDAKTLSLREQEIANAAKRNESMATVADAKAGEAAAKAAAAKDNADPASERSHRMQEYFVRNGVPMRSVMNLSPDDMKQLSPELSRQFEQADPQASREIDIAGRKAGASSAATLADRLALQRASAEERAKAQQAPPRGYAITAEDIKKIPGVISDDDESLTHALQTRGQASAINDVIKNGKRGELATREMARALNDYYDAASSGDVHAWSNARERIGAYAIETEGTLAALHGGQGTAEDRSRLEKLVPNPYESIGDAAKAAITGQDRIAGLRDMVKSNADSQGAAYHIHFDFDGSETAMQQRKNRARRAAPAPQTTAPVAADDLDDL